MAMASTGYGNGKYLMKYKNKFSLIYYMSYHFWAVSN